MSKTILAQVDGFTPIIDSMIPEVGLLTAAVFGKAWRYCQMADGVCKAGQERIADELGLTRATINTHFSKLCETGYLTDLTPTLAGKPHEYADTGKANLSISFTAGIRKGVKEIDTTCKANLQVGVKEIDTKKVLKKVTKKEDIKSVDAKSASTPVKPVTAKPRTDARKLGDPMDGILKYGRDALDPLVALTARIQEYPEELQDLLRWVCGAQGWAASAIPAQERRGKVNPDYLWWIRELNDLAAQLDGFGESAIKAASLQASDITISHPGALRQTLISVVGRLRKKAQPPQPIELTPFERVMRGLPSLQ
jgi:hypothetical protein